MSTSIKRKSKLSTLIKRLQDLYKENGDLYVQGVEPTFIDRWSEPTSMDKIQLDVEEGTCEKVIIIRT